MKYRMPTYYSEFECIAGECPKTCCAGWEIVIDDEAMEMYKQLQGDDNKWIHSKINTDENIFRQNGSKCACLGDDNLCSLYTRLGEDKLCRTCTTYPRHFEEFGNLLEKILSMSCPVAAKLILENENSSMFLESEDNKTSGFEDELSESLIETLVATRQNILECIIDRKIPFAKRIEKILAYSEKIQNKLDEYKYLDPKYTKKLYQLLYKKKISNKAKAIETEIKNIKIDGETDLGIKISKTSKGRQGLTKKYMEMFLGLEVTEESVKESLAEIIKTLYSDMSEEEYIELSNEFSKLEGLLVTSKESSEDKTESQSLYKTESQLIDKVKNQLLYGNIINYFIYTYYLGGIYDYNILAMVKRAILSMIYIREVSMYEWYMNNKTIKKEAQIKICYTYSRELEHSDTNLMLTEGLLIAHPLFETSNLLSLL